MSVRRAITLKGGGTLVIYKDGKKTYLPSKKYQDFREQYLKPKQFKGKPDTEKNCFKLLAAAFGYPMKCGDLLMTCRDEGTSIRLVIWKDQASC